MKQEKLPALLERLRKLPEFEWIEFKESNYNPQVTGEYISALANSACYHRKDKAYLVFGIENETHKIVGTKFKPKEKKVGNEELENWLITQLNPRIDFEIHEFQVDGKPVVLFEIGAAANTPVEFRGEAFIRVGSYKKKLSAHPEKARKIWTYQPGFDWTAQIIQEASLNHLEPLAIEKARQEFKKKHPTLAEDVDTWDDLVFLNKAKITIDGAITRAALILLGKDEFSHLLQPAVPQITWVLKDEHNTGIDYHHFGLPFILEVGNVLNKIRNLNYRYMPYGTLFPNEVPQYDPWVIREALHNCIAHQDYRLRGRINVVEKPNRLIFSNLGGFIPGSVEAVIEKDSPPEVYRNPFLAAAMVNLDMIDTMGNGIKKMFLQQRSRFFPLPDFDLSQEERTVVTIFGEIIDKNYTQLLINFSGLSLRDVMMLDKVQKNKPLEEKEYRRLKSLELIEGISPDVRLISRDVRPHNGRLRDVGSSARCKVFISSTYVDLKEYRQAAIDVVNRYDDCELLAMEFFASQSQDTTEVCQKEIQACDVLVGIYAHRYGFIPQGQDKSVIHLEYELAKILGKKCLFFIVDQGYPWNPGFIEMDKYARLQAFLDEVKNEYAVEFFESTTHFKSKLSESLGKLLMENRTF
jgi:ATP-dependent DNA helicase RecG